MQTIIIVLGIEQGWAGIPVPENFERIWHFHSLSQKMGMQFYHFLATLVALDFTPVSE